MLQPIANIPAGVLAFEAHGRVVGEDYEQRLVPALESELARGGKVRFLYHLGPDFTGFSARALWADAKVGLRHWRRFERIAVVTEVKWVARAVTLFGRFVATPVRLFPEKDFGAAKTWIASGLVPPVASPS